MAEICMWCEKPIDYPDDIKRKNKKFCSADCKKSYYANTDAVCVECGTIFRANDSRKRCYKCSIGSTRIVHTTKAKSEPKYTIDEYLNNRDSIKMTYGQWIRSKEK